MMNPVFAQYYLMKRLSDARVAKIRADYRMAQDSPFMRWIAPVALLIAVAIALKLG